MKLRKIIISLSLSAVSALTHAQQADFSALPVYAEREFSTAQYDYTYAYNPAALSWWDYETWSVAGASFAYAKGSLHHPRTYDRMAKATVRTESILRQPEKKWTFHGRFIYENGSADSVRTNLSYWLRETGSPSFYFCRKPASRWNLQKYGLEAAASRQIGERWSAGGQVEYTGDLAFRKSDTRNQQTTLTIHAVLSGTFKVTPNHILSLGADFLRTKEKPSFSRAYNTGPDYNTYLMNGLGTYIKDLETNVSWREIVPGAFVQWIQRSSANRASVTYKFSDGNDRWMNNAMQSESGQDIWTKYGYMRHSLLFSDIVTIGNSLLNIRGDGQFTSGRGHSWNKTTSVYIQNYDYSGIDAGLELEWRPGRTVVKQVAAGVEYVSDTRRDKSYDYLFSSASIDASLSFLSGFVAGKAVLTAGAGAVWHHCTGLTDEPGAAVESNNEYTKYIGVPLAVWAGTDYADAGVTFNADVPVKNVLIGIGAKADYSLPVGKVNEIYSNTGFFGGQVFLNVYF